MKKCYNCGVVLNTLKKDQRTKEHIPAQTFFEGYPEEYKSQRITVPACYECNNDYSKIDDIFRDLVGVINENDPQKAVITQKSMKKILSNKKELDDRLSIGKGGVWVTFDMNAIDKLHKKNFKGIYTFLAKKPLPDSYSLDVYSIGQDEKKLALGATFISELKAIGDWQKSGSEKVFKYKMAYLDLEDMKLIAFDSINSSLGPKVLVCAIEYNLSVVSLIVGMDSTMRNF